MTHTVLVIEDEEELREMMRDALELNGYDVVTAADGQDALDRMRGIEHLCIIILDLLMPVMNGWEFLEKLRLNAALATVPVVVHSSATNHLLAGATRVLRKPIEYERLLSVVREYCAPSSS